MRDLWLWYIVLNFLAYWLFLQSATEKFEKKLKQTSLLNFAHVTTKKNLRRPYSVVLKRNQHLNKLRWPVGF